MTATTTSPLEELQREQRALDRDIDATPPCTHGTSAALPDVCDVCGLWRRWDEVQRAIVRLLRHERSAA